MKIVRFVWNGIKRTYNRIKFFYMSKSITDKMKVIFTSIDRTFTVSEERCQSNQLKYKVNCGNGSYIEVTLTFINNNPNDCVDIDTIFEKISKNRIVHKVSDELEKNRQYFSGLFWIHLNK